MRDLLVALVNYIVLCAAKSDRFSSPGYDGHAHFLAEVRELDGSSVIYIDGWGQHLDLNSPWRTLYPWTKKSKTEQKSLGLDKKVQD